MSREWSELRHRACTGEAQVHLAGRARRRQVVTGAGPRVAAVALAAQDVTSFAISRGWVCECGATPAYYTSASSTESAPVTDESRHRRADHGAVAGHDLASMHTC